MEYGSKPNWAWFCQSESRTMANPGEVKPANQSKCSGKETLQYRKVQANLVNICDALVVNKGAEKALHLNIQQKGWITPTDETPTDNLMGVVLNRIDNWAETYDEFMEILGTIEGLDLIKKRIATTTGKRLMIANT